MDRLSNALDFSATKRVGRGQVFKDALVVPLRSIYSGHIARSLAVTATTRRFTWECRGQGRFRSFTQVPALPWTTKGEQDMPFRNLVSPQDNEW